MLGRLTAGVVVLTAAVLIANAGASTHVKRVKRPDLAVTAVASPIAVVAGDRTTFRVTVRNSGRRAARTVSLVGIDLFSEDGGTDFLDVNPTQGRCALRIDVEQFECSLGTIRARATVQILVTALPHALPLVEGTSWLASVIGLTPERNYTNNTVMATAYVAVPAG